MAMTLVRRVAVATALLMLLARPSDLASCGPYFRMAIFARKSVPENEKAFFEGQIGILQPTYWRRYLAMSYRMLQGIPLSESQVASIGSIGSMGYIWREPTSGPAPATPVERWEKARKQVPGAQPVKIEQYRDSSAFTQIANCGNDAFLAAIATLNERIRMAGASSPEVLDWLAAQDVVFSNCGGKTDPPSPAPPGSSARIVADRDYQIAAAQFYAGAYEEAKESFAKIAADRASPWHAMAPYLAARADIRNGEFAMAQSALQSIVTDPRQAAIHDKAASLLEYVDARVDPAKRLAFCAKRLLIRDSPTLGHDLSDYTFLSDRLDPIKEPQDEITTWIHAFRDGQEDDLVKRWEQDRSLPWLVAAMDHAVGSSSHADDLIDAARQVTFDSPGWPLARFHAVRLLIEQGKKPEAREMLNEVAGHLKGTTASAIDSFRAEQMKVAENLQEFLADAPRIPAGDQTIGYWDEADPSKKDAATPMIDRDASTAFNAFLPLNLWLASIRDSKLPKPIRTALTQAGFVRAIILGDPLAADFARVLRELKPSYAAEMDRYLAASQDRRVFEAEFWLVHHPEASPMTRSGLPRGMDGDTPDARIDTFHDNWWCAESEPKIDDLTSVILKRLYPDGWKTPAFLTAEQQAQAAAEIKALAAGGGPGFLSKSVLAWAHAHPDDPRLAEALALAVKSSHYGCTDKDSEGPVSDAFRLLHRRFPGSTWAKQTPYWYH